MKGPVRRVERKSDLRIGVQIAKVPDHANGDLEHPDVQFGFVTKVTKEGAFCRYWNKNLTALRTRSGSELTPFKYLMKYDSKPHYVITDLLEEIEITEKMGYD